MAEAVVEPRRSVYRFFCHRCNVEFEDVMQDYTCPYCATGFIERLESDRDGDSLNQEDGEYSDAEMSNIDDAGHGEESEYSMMDDSQGPPVLNDLAFLMSGGNIRNNGGGRQESGTVMDHFLWMIGGGRPGTGAVTAGSPFVLVGAPGDYVFGGEGLDAVVTQLLGQLENTGPAPLPRDLIEAIPNQQITAEQVEANLTCSVCWDNFTLGETVSRLECEHIFHPACITPWLQLHATCPICRRSLIPGGGMAGAGAGATADDARSDDSLDTGSSASRRRATPSAVSQSGAVNASTTPSSSSSTTDTSASTASMPSYSRVVVRRLPAGSARRRRGTQTGVGAATGAVVGGGAWDSDSSSSGLTAHVTPGGLWAQLTSTLANAANAATGAQPDSTSTSSLNSDRDRHYMDIDFD